jgi:hypothetical protein
MENFEKIINDSIDTYKNNSSKFDAANELTYELLQKKLNLLSNQNASEILGDEIYIKDEKALVEKLALNQEPQESTDTYKSTLKNDLFANTSNQNVKSSRPSSGEIRKLACLAQTLNGYLITINSRKNADRLNRIISKLYESVNLWISRLFR